MIKANTILRNDGYRECRQCKREWEARRRHLVARVRDTRRGYGYIPPKERTHCPEGHPLTPIPYRPGWRHCKICIKENRRWRQGYYEREGSKRWPRP